VLAAAGIDPVSEAEERERRGDILQIGEVPGRPRSGGSTWQSLQRRTGTVESDYLNGEIVSLGREYDVATPANELIPAGGRAARPYGPSAPDGADASTAGPPHPRCGLSERWALATSVDRIDDEPITLSTEVIHNARRVGGARTRDP
jgi:hypothetical protein